MAPKTTLKIGIIGAGMRAYLASHSHKPENGSVVVACADINKNALDLFKQKFGQDIFSTRDYKKLLSIPEIDAVFILSPDHCHKEHAIAALQAGKHVYLEKPMAITIEDCDNILKAAFKNKAKLYLGHNMRHMSFVLKMKELINGGVIGEVKTAWCRHFISYGGDAYFKDWHSDRSKSTGLLLQKATHDIDVLHWLCGGYTQKVTAMGGLTLYNQIADRHAISEYGDASCSDQNWPPLSLKGLNHVVDVEDISMMLMQLNNGVFASYQQCHYTPDAWRNYCIIGTEGRIENFGDEPGNCIIKLWNKRSSYKPDGDKQFVIPLETGSHGGADAKIVAEFVRYVRDDGKITTSPIAARYSVAAGYMATQSLRNGGKPIEIPLVSKEYESYFNKDVNCTTTQPIEKL
jgi:predicted dehydrogenase